MTRIFAEFAPKYWASGINVIPLRAHDKMPVQNGWQKWGIEQIPDSVKQSWLDGYGSGNIGVPAGPASNLAFVDIDTFDPALLAKIEAVLPKTPWRRVGEKGCVLAFQWNGEKSFKIISREAAVNIEVFSSSGQVVLPPSIHPKTKRPYVSNTHLWEIKHQLPELGQNIQQMMRKFVRELGIKCTDNSGPGSLLEKVSRGSRDTMLIKHAGTLAFEIIRGRITLKDALDTLEDWAVNMSENVAGDNVDVDKGRQRIVEFLVKSVRERKVALPKGWNEGLDEELKRSLNLGAISENDVSLDFSEIKGRFQQEYEEALSSPMAEQKKIQVVESTLQRMARSQSLSELETDSLLEVLQANCKGMKISSLRKGLRRYQFEGIEGTNQTEIAEAVLQDFKDIELRFDFGHLYEWYGSHWRKKNYAELDGHIAKAYGHLPAARRQTDHGGIRKIICNLVSKPLKLTSTPGINFANGYLTTELRLLAHDRDFGMTYEMPYEYRPELHDKCHRFLQFLHDAWDGDQERIDLMQEAIAITLFGLGPKFQKAFLLYGVPHSGKSVMLKILSALVPDEARCSVPPHKMHERFALADLNGAIMNFAGELPDKKMIESSVFKSVIDGSEMTSEYKNKDMFKFCPSATHWFGSNALPKTSDVSVGFLRRWMIIPFTKAVPEEKSNIHLADEIIAAEREAIASWAVDAIGRVLARNYLTMPRVSIAMTEELGSVVNPIRTWFKERVELAPGEVKEEIAFNDYNHFCLVKSYRKLDRSNFRTTLRELAAANAFRCVNLPDGTHRYEGVRLVQASGKGTQAGRG